MGYSRQNPHPHDMACWKISREGSEAKSTSLVVTLSISSMFQSLQSISFQKIALPFQILLFFQTTDLLPHLLKVSIHRLTPFVETTCDNLKIQTVSRKIA